MTVALDWFEGGFSCFFDGFVCGFCIFLWRASWIFKQAVFMWAGENQIREPCSESLPCFSGSLGKYFKTKQHGTKLKPLVKTYKTYKTTTKKLLKTVKKPQKSYKNLVFALVATGPTG